MVLLYTTKILSHATLLLLCLMVLDPLSLSPYGLKLYIILFFLFCCSLSQFWNTQRTTTDTLCLDFHSFLLFFVLFLRIQTIYKFIYVWKTIEGIDNVKILIVSHLGKLLYEQHLKYNFLLNTTHKNISIKQKTKQKKLKT